MAYSMISDITPKKESWKIKVRIIRLWYQPAYNNPNGSKIQATIKKTHINRFQKMVTEGSMRLISHFGVISKLGSIGLRTMLIK
ncbi:hypothetical protein RDABS01_034778 [Bienertia sinuspersici]